LSNATVVRLNILKVDFNVMNAILIAQNAMGQLKIIVKLATRGIFIIRLNKLAYYLWIKVVQTDLIYKMMLVKYSSK